MDDAVGGSLVGDVVGGLLVDDAVGGSLLYDVVGGSLLYDVVGGSLLYDVVGGSLVGGSLVGDLGGSAASMPASVCALCAGLALGEGLVLATGATAGRSTSKEAVALCNGAVLGPATVVADSSNTVLAGGLCIWLYPAITTTTRTKKMNPAGRAVCHRWPGGGCS